MESTIKNLLVGHAQTLFGAEITESSIQFQPTRKDVDGDFTLVTFPFVKMLKCTPEQAGEIIGNFLKTNLPEIASYEVIKGFLNLKVELGADWDLVVVADSNPNVGRGGCNCD